MLSYPNKKRVHMFEEEKYVSSHLGAAKWAPQSGRRSFRRRVNSAPRQLSAAISAIRRRDNLAPRQLGAFRAPSKG